jgi:hypothetical protein
MHRKRRVESRTYIRPPLAGTLLRFTPPVFEKKKSKIANKAIFRLHTFTSPFSSRTCARQRARPATFMVSSFLSDLMGNIHPRQAQFLEVHDKRGSSRLRLLLL